MPGAIARDDILDPAASILLLGAGGHAVACIDVIELHGGYRIAGLVGRSEEYGGKLLGYSIVGTDDKLSDLLGVAVNAMVAIGQIRSSDRRSNLYRAIVDAGFARPAIVSPHAYVSPHATLGAGSMVMHGAIINAGVSVGENCIVNSRALVEHGARVGNHCHIATGAIVNGDAELGDGVFVGSNAVIREGVVLGRNCVVGMGLSVRCNQPANSQILVSN